MDDQASSRLPELHTDAEWSWQAALDGGRAGLEAVLAEAIPSRRWFGSKTRTIRRLEIVDAAELSPRARLLLVRLHYTEGTPELYQIPLGYVDPASVGTQRQAGWINVVRAGQPAGQLVDALTDPDFCQSLLAAFEAKLEIATAADTPSSGTLAALPTAAFARLRGEGPLAARLVAAEQSNSSLIFGDRLILKLFRKVEQGINPDLEISEFLTQHEYPHTPALAGAIIYHAVGQEPWPLAMLQAYVPNRGDAWQATLAELTPLFASLPSDPPSLPPASMLQASATDSGFAPPAVFAPSLAQARLLGTRTAELHLTLARSSEPAFAPERFLEADRDSFVQEASERSRETLGLLRTQAAKMSGLARVLAERVLALESSLLDRYRQFANESPQVYKIRCHGDYHLGQVLSVIGDFMIIDFEGEPARPLSQRRQKQLALRDVAGMIRSYHYAACMAANAQAAAAGASEHLLAWRDAWYFWSSAAFLAGYREAAGDSAFLPPTEAQFQLVLDACMLQKATYELQYELNNRPDWVYLPLTALVELLVSKGGS